VPFAIGALFWFWSSWHKGFQIHLPCRLHLLLNLVVQQNIRCLVRGKVAPLEAVAIIEQAWAIDIPSQTLLLWPTTIIFLISVVVYPSVYSVGVVVVVFLLTKKMK